MGWVYLSYVVTVWQKAAVSCKWSQQQSCGCKEVFLASPSVSLLQPKGAGIFLSYEIICVHCHAGYNALFCVWKENILLSFSDVNASLHTIVFSMGKEP